MAPPFLQILAGSLPAFVSGVTSRPVGMPYFKHVMFAGLRAMGASRDYTDKQRFIEAPSATDIYRAFAKQSGFEPVVVPLETGGEGLWIGAPTSQHVILFFHGGGYANPAESGHWMVCQNLVTMSKTKGEELAVFALAYDLGWKATYPTQLQQALGALSYLTNTVKLDVEDIILGGDSAGGNLVLALLSHLRHPHPKVTSFDIKSAKLRGAFMLSPWVSFEYDTKSAQANASIDFVTASGLSQASTMFLGGVANDEYTVPLSASTTWWEGLAVGSVFMTAGSYEVFADSIEAFYEKFKVCHAETELFMAEHEVHDQAVVDNIMKYPMCDSEKRLHQWLQTVL